MDDRLKEYISDVGGELESNYGVALWYAGRVVIPEEWIALVVEQEAREFEESLREHLDGVLARLREEEVLAREGIEIDGRVFITSEDRYGRVEEIDTDDDSALVVIEGLEYGEWYSFDDLVVANE